MTNLDVSNSSTDSSSGSSSDSSSSGSSSTSSGSGSSSSDSESSTSDIPAVAQPAPESPAKPDEEPPKKKDDSKPKQSSNKKISSSSDDDAPKTEAPKSPPPRRRSSTKQKSAVSVLVRGKMTRAAAGAKTPKPISKTMTKQQAKNDHTKKKSIFSPDNSSESELDSKSSKGKGSPKNKRSVRKSSEEKDTSPPSPLTSAGNEDSSSKDSIKRRNGSRCNGPPSKKLVEKKSVSSCSSSQSSAETVSSESDSESNSKKESVKTETKSPSSSIKQEKGKSDSGDSQMNSMPRKLTRSLSARVSRMATASRPRNTDTESEVEEKVNDKSKETKKKCRVAIARSPMNDLPPLHPSERRCPVRGCDSSGHLGGKAERHFTWDACPLYHNVTPAWCVAAAEERAAAAAARRRALVSLQQRPRTMPTIEQRAYQLKVKDMRSKWKGSGEMWARLADDAGSGEEREPQLEGFAPDYDLRLFREAQALAAVRIEEELGDIHTDRGTRFVVMGKFMMEVWYQSPYPGTAARAPRLFVCEFCLNHHQSATGAARHRAKCVWRHPPGDEVYRKETLSVWQVDGRKHKQYCQQLCLLAKFFLDHKTLYYDVEPFLFYVMTCADDEGCHVVGYFSKIFGVARNQDFRGFHFVSIPIVQGKYYVQAKPEPNEAGTKGVAGRRHIDGRSKARPDRSEAGNPIFPAEEKNSFLNYNVSCILTLPPYQRQGYGRLLIDFSYLLTKVEGKVGSPETPLSDLGLISYRSYWKEALLKRLCSASGPTLSIRDLSKDLAIASSDIVSTLQERGLMKYWKGKHIVLKKQDVLEEVSRRAERARCVEASCLRWTPPGAPPPR